MARKMGKGVDSTAGIDTSKKNKLKNRKSLEDILDGYVTGNLTPKKNIK